MSLQAALLRQQRHLDREVSLREHLAALDTLSRDDSLTPEQRDRALLARFDVLEAAK